MHEIRKSNDHSVYMLLTELCRIIATENGINEHNGLEQTVPRMRALAYETLLKKSSKVSKWSKQNNDQPDALRMLNEHIFITKLQAKSRGVDKSMQIDSQLDQLLSRAGAYFSTKEGNEVLQLLLALQCNPAEDEWKVNVKRHRELLVPAAFTVQASYQNNRYYPKKYTILPKNAEPKYFQSLQKMKASAKRGFVPQNFPQSVRCMLPPAPPANNFHAENASAINDDSECTFTAMTRRHICSDADWLRIDMRSLQFNIQKSCDFYALQMSVISKKPLQSLEISNAQLLDITAEKEKPSQHPKCEFERRRTTSWSWDQIGSKNGFESAKPFSSDINIPFELEGLVCQHKKQHFQAKVLANEEFLRDLKLLTVGLQSDIFSHNEDLVFKAVPNVTVENILPATMANYIHEFLECGTCYKRLHSMISKRNHKLTNDGFIFKALCSAVNEYLLTFRQYVFSYKQSETLISFYKRMKKVMAQIQNLSFTLGVNSRVGPEANLPKGSQFLGYLYREIIRLTDNEYITLLMFLLKRCCHVYFKFLQLWIFHGILDDPSKELFIQYIDHYRKNTKHFYDKAYIVRREIVPGFFQNYEDRILLCGKYTMLLKAYNPNHPLFDLECPKIAACLSFEEIQKLEVSCQTYAEKAREICGKPITVRDIFEAREKRRRDFQKMVFQRSRENIDRWNLEQLNISKKIAENKRKRLEELSAQLEEAKQNRIEKRRKSVENELKALREAQKFNDERLKKENINLRKRIEYYQELSDSLKTNAIDDALSTTTSSSKRIRRYSLTHESEIVGQTPKTPATASSIYSFSTTSLETSPQSKLDLDVISTCAESESGRFDAEFTKTAYELNEYLEKRNKEYSNSNNNYCDDTFSVRGGGGGERNVIPPKRSLRRSISDVINSNLSHEKVASLPITNLVDKSSLQLNRLRTLTGTIGLCFNGDNLKANNTPIDNHKKSSEILRVTFEEDHSVPVKKVMSKALTELELNKLKVLTANEALCLHSHKDRTPHYHKSLPDVNLNIVEENTDLTDLERNRKRMMEGPTLFDKYDNPSISTKSLERAPSNEIISELERNRKKILTEEYGYGGTKLTSKKSDIDIHTLPDEMLTDMQRNRRHMMESPHPFVEFNKPALSDRPKLNLNLETDRARNRRKVLESEYNILTGDATLSTKDILTPMSTTSDPPTITTDQMSESEQRSDSLNGNLRLNIISDQETSTHISTAATTQPPTTPFEALTTAGVRARTEGFQFAQENENHNESSGYLNLTTTTDCDELDSTQLDSSFKYLSPYEWCNQLIESKFKCPSRSSIFRLNLDSSNKTAAASKEQNSIKDFKIDSLSVITLTEFLQKSIIMPMNTHMELVNGEVMRVLLQDLHLIDHFRSLRHYFFLMDGEFGSIICDGIIGRVESGDQPAQVLSYQMLHMILDIALSFSIQKDNNAENLSFIVSVIPQKFDLNSPSVLNVLSLCYHVHWPLNLILNPETLERYGIIFKYLLKVRRISWVLEKAFELLRQAAKKHGKRLLRSPQYLRTQQIRHKFYHFVHALQNHITATALQASWKLFKDELIHAKSLEDIYRMHTNYIKRITFLCMLNPSSNEFFNAIENIFKISLKFYNNLKSREFIQLEGAKDFTHCRFNKMVADEEDFDKLLKFTIHLGNKIVRRGYQAEIGEFITLININKYYTS